LNALRHLKMAPGEVKSRDDNCMAPGKPARDRARAGYLVTEFAPDSLFVKTPFGVSVRKGDLLGTVFDPYSFEELERIVAPVDGLLYVCRTSGPIEAGGHAYAVTAYEGSRWVD
jgi:hypothetical protein